MIKYEFQKYQEKYLYEIFHNNSYNILQKLFELEINLDENILKKILKENNNLQMRKIVKNKRYKIADKLIKYFTRKEIYDMMDVDLYFVTIYKFRASENT